MKGESFKRLTTEFADPGTSVRGRWSAEICAIRSFAVFAVKTPGALSLTLFYVGCVALSQQILDRPAQHRMNEIR